MSYRADPLRKVRLRRYQLRSEADACMSAQGRFATVADRPEADIAYRHRRGPVERVTSHHPRLARRLSRSIERHRPEVFSTSTLDQRR
jgi:hypothetical protein